MLIVLVTVVLEYISLKSQLQTTVMFNAPSPHHGYITVINCITTRYTALYLI